jgi:ParB/RepB/Spo0J family partition protein
MTITTDTAEPADAPATAPEAPKFRTEEAIYLPLGLIRPSPFNPRKRFDQAKLDQLADSIEAKGVQQAIVVRKLASAKKGEPLYEIVAGERRWRACKLVEQRGKFPGPGVVPSFIRELDDFEAREIALMENTDRDDLHPLEQAQGYEELLIKPVGGGEFSPPRVRGYTVDQLAERIGHPRNFVFGRLKLLQLIPAAREAFLDDKLQLKTAEALARYPASEQERALNQLVIGWAGEPYTHRQALAYLRDNFSLKLGKARFDIADAALLEQAGACNACPKRSSANPDLFGEGNSEDLCLDGGCFKAKTEAHTQRELDQAKAEGAVVATEKQAKRILGGYSHVNDYTIQANGYVRLDGPAESLTASKKALRTLLGDEKIEVTIVQPEGSDKPVRLVKLADARTILAAKGLLVAPETAKAAKTLGRKPTAEDLKQQRGRRILERINQRLPEALWKHLSNDGREGLPGGPVFLLALAEHLYQFSELEWDGLARAATGSTQLAGQAWLKDLDWDGLAKACVTMLLCGRVTDEEYASRRDLDASNDELASDVGFDLRGLRAEVQEEVDSAIRDEVAALAKSDQAEKPAAKKAPSKKAAPAAKKTKPAKPAPTTKAEALTPEQALANAVQADGKIDGDKLEDVAWPFPGDKSAEEQMHASATKKPTLSPAAAWPFPTGPKAESSEAPPQSATTEKPAKVRKGKAAAVKAEEAPL